MNNLAIKKEKIDMKKIIETISSREKWSNEKMCIFKKGDVIVSLQIHSVSFMEMQICFKIIIEKDEYTDNGLVFYKLEDEEFTLNIFENKLKRVIVTTLKDVEIDIITDKYDLLEKKITANERSFENKFKKLEEEHPTLDEEHLNTLAKDGMYYYYIIDFIEDYMYSEEFKEARKDIEESSFLKGV